MLFKGCDIPNIKQVVQFMVPNNLSIWMQRAGRGGRNRLISAQAILLVQPSVFQEVKASSAKSKKAPVGSIQVEESDNINYRKTVEEGLREWIEAEGCRRDVADEYFWDGSQRQSMSRYFLLQIIFLTEI
jgi:superfamily II DNA helicase RecQ